MKLSKPVYNGETKTYSCVVQEGVRVQEASQVQLPDLVQFIIEHTNGWFTKPLKVDWLTPRVKLSFETPKVDTDFCGTVTWAWSDLLISKDSFQVLFKVVDIQEDPKISLEPEQEGVEGDLEIIENEPTGNLEAPPISIGPTRRQLQKEIVMKARERAARALFYAERLTQEYVHEFGDDTDWEDESLDSDSEREE
jgi:hypothetical protein